MYILIDLISEVYFPFMKSFEVDCTFFYFWVQKLHIRIFNQYQLFYLPANKNLLYWLSKAVSVQVSFTTTFHQTVAAMKCLVLLDVALQLKCD